MGRVYLLLASLLAAAYVAVLVGGPMLRLSGAGDAYTLRLSVASLAPWLSAAIALLVAWGLLCRYRWAWWLGAAAAAFQLVRFGLAMAPQLSLSRLPDLRVAAGELVLLVFLGVLLAPRTREACTR